MCFSPTQLNRKDECFLNVWLHDNSSLDKGGGSTYPTLPYDSSPVLFASVANQQFGWGLSYLDCVFFIFEEEVHLCSSVLLTEGALSHNSQLLLQSNVKGPGLHQSTTHTYTDRALRQTPQTQKLGQSPSASDIDRGGRSSQVISLSKSRNTTV